MAGVDDYRQMREGFDSGNGGNIEGVSGVSLESSDSALAEDNIHVAARHDIFGAHQQLLQGVRKSALEKYGLVDMTELL